MEQVEQVQWEEAERAVERSENGAAHYFRVFEAISKKIGERGQGVGRLALSAAVWGNNKLGNATATLVAPTAAAGNGARGSEGGRLSRASEGHTPVTFSRRRAPILCMPPASTAFYSLLRCQPRGLYSVA